jgi:hypothetical protein
MFEIIFRSYRHIATYNRHAQRRTRGCHKLSDANQNVHLSTDLRHVLEYQMLSKSLQRLLHTAE